MKKLFAWFFSIMICFTTIIGSFSVVNAEGFDDANRVLFQKAEFYFSKATSSQINITVTQADTLTNADADVQRMIYQMSKSDADFAAKAQKIFDFWEQINLVGGTTNLYHPNSDYSINKDDMITTFTNDDSVAIFMYGNAMQADGSMSAENIGRCNTVLALAQQYPNAYIILSGGHTQYADNKHSKEDKYVPQYDSEAGASFKYLTQTALQPTYMDGTAIEDAQPVLETKYIDATRPTIDPSRIILDERAQDTVGNITNGMAALDDYPQIKYFVTVTSDYHIQRATFFLASYIDTRELGYEIIGNLGFVVTPKKTEYLGMQYSGAASILGVSTSSAVPTVSTPKSIEVVKDGKVVSEIVSEEGYKGIELSQVNGLDTLKVIAKYNNASEKQKVENFTLDVTKYAEFIGYDPESKDSQSVTVKYTYNGETVETSLKVINVEKTAEELLQEQLAKEKAEFEKKIKDLQDELAECVKEQESLAKENKDLAATIKKLQQQIDELKAEYEAKIAELKAEYEAQQQQIDELIAQGKQFKDRFEDLENQIKNNKTAVIVLIASVIIEAAGVIYVALRKKQNS